MDYTGKRILVTGGCGFIGSHMVDRLLAEGVAAVTIIDSMDYGIREQVSTDTRVRIITSEIENPKLTDSFPDGETYDYLLHLAARKHNQSKGTPDKLFASNITGVYRLLELAVRLKIKKMMFSSSLFAYGRWQGEPMREDEIPQPTTLYGISKLTGEHLFAWCSKQHGIPFVVLRYFFVYGPRQYPGLVYKSVIMKNFSRMIRGEAAIIHGDGTQVLDYIYIDDVIEGTLRALADPCSGEVVNISSGHGISIQELSDAMHEVSGATKKYTYEPPDETHNSYRVGDGSKAKELFGFVPKVSLHEGLSRTFTWLTTQTRSYD